VKKAALITVLTRDMQNKLELKLSGLSPKDKEELSESITEAYRKEFDDKLKAILGDGEAEEEE
jgi:hypothetical protein